MIPTDRPTGPTLSLPTAVFDPQAQLSIPQVARLLQCSERWLDGIVRAGELHATHLGRAVRISRQHLQEFLDSRNAWFPRAPRSVLMTPIKALLQRFVVKSGAEYPRDGLHGVPVALEPSLRRDDEGSTSAATFQDDLGVGCLHLVQ